MNGRTRLGTTPTRPSRREPLLPRAVPPRLPLPRWLDARRARLIGFGLIREHRATGVLDDAVVRHFEQDVAAERVDGGVAQIREVPQLFVRVVGKAAVVELQSQVV